jgi:hypothetical protein
VECREASVPCRRGSRAAQDHLVRFPLPQEVRTDAIAMALPLERSAPWPNAIFGMTVARIDILVRTPSRWENHRQCDRIKTQASG